MSQTELCKNFKAYFITGLGAAIEYIEYIKSKQKQVIQIALFGDYYDVDKLEIIGNWTVLPWNKNEELVDRIVSIVEDSENTYSCGKVRLVFIGHSHGAEMIANAYYKLQNKYSGRLNEWEAIYEKSALFTLGGVSYVDDSMAKLTLNVVFDNDEVSRACRIMKIGTQKLGWVMDVGPYRNGECKCCAESQSAINADKPNIKEAKENPDSILDTTGCLGKIGFNFSSNCSQNISVGSLELVKRSIPTSSVKSVGKAQEKIRELSGSTAPAHYLDHYLKCRAWRAQIRDMLQTNNHRARCSCQPI